VSIILKGNGPEARSVRLFKGAGETRLPLEDPNKMESSASFHFLWKAADGNEHDMVPIISATGFKFPETGEDLADFFFLLLIKYIRRLKMLIAFPR